MAGKKGRSGRKSWDKEVDAKSLWDLSVPVLKYALTSNDVPLLKKTEIATALISKMMPIEFKGKLEGDLIKNIFIYAAKPAEINSNSESRIPAS